MDWSSIFTQKQRDRLVAETTMQLNDLLAWAEKDDLKKEVVISSIYGADCLVVKEGRLAEKICWLSRLDSDPNKYTYECIAQHEYLSVIEKYRLTPREVIEAKKKTESQLLEERSRVQEKANALAELEKLTQSPVISDLIKEIRIAGSDFGDRLILRRDGLSEMTNGDVRDLGRNDLKNILEKYNLSYNELANWRKRIEA